MFENFQVEFKFSGPHMFKTNDHFFLYKKRKN